MKHEVQLDATECNIIYTILEVEYSINKEAKLWKNFARPKNS